MIKFLLDGLQADWITTSFPIIRIVLFVIILLCSIGLIVAILLQRETSDQGAAIGSVQESYYADNKGKSKDGKLKKLTIAMACIIAICAVLYFVSLIINNPA